jgi:hypothetical protein
MPLLIAVMTFATFLWEIYFPALVWIRPIRRYVLLFGVFLHAMIALSVGLVFFSAAMVSTYIFFVDREWLTEKILRFWPDGGETVVS